MPKQNLHSAFWRRSAQRGPIRVILGTAHTTIVVPTHHRQMCRSAADAHLRGSRTRHPVRKTLYASLSYTPVIRRSLANRKTTWEGVVSVTPGPHPAITWYPTCHHHSQHALGAHVYLPLFSWALRRQKVSR